MGYTTTKVYSIDDNMEVIAYSTEPVKFREEPILLDDGGARMPSSNKQFFEVFKNKKKRIGNRCLNIAIRYPNTTNQSLYNTVREILEPFCIDQNQKLVCKLGDPKLETIVYSLRRTE